jgi:hypothetical protein
MIWYYTQTLNNNLIQKQYLILQTIYDFCDTNLATTMSTPPVVQ